MNIRPPHVMLSVGRCRSSLIRIAIVHLILIVVTTSALSASLDHDVHKHGDGEVTVLYDVMACVVMVTSGIFVTFGGLCYCCRNKSTVGRANASSSGHYVGQIDLADIQVIYNPSAIMTPPHSPTSGYSSASSSGNRFDAVVENPGVTTTSFNNHERPVDAAVKSGRPNNERLSNVLVENGRIVLQYQNVHAANAAETQQPTSGRRKSTDDNDDIVTSQPVPAGNRQQWTKRASRSRDTDSQTADYDMNDVVWKNVNATYSVSS